MKEEKRLDFIQIRVNKKEKEKIKEKAAENNMSVGTYVRYKCLK